MNIISLSCPTCGASLKPSFGYSHYHCNNCGKFSAITDIQQSELQLSSSDPVLKIPIYFENSQDVLVVFLNWLANDAKTPNDIIDDLVINKCILMYLPIFHNSGACTASYSFEYGVERTEHYTEYVKKTKDGREVTVPEHRTKVVVDYHPHSGLINTGFGGSSFAFNPISVDQEIELTDDSLPGGIHRINIQNALYEKSSVTIPHWMVPFNANDDQDARIYYAEQSVKEEFYNIQNNHNNIKNKRLSAVGIIDYNVIKGFYPYIYIKFNYKKSAENFYCMIDGVLMDETNIKGPRPIDDNREESIKYLQAKRKEQCQPIGDLILNLENSNFKIGVAIVISIIVSFLSLLYVVFAGDLEAYYAASSIIGTAIILIIGLTKRISIKKGIRSMEDEKSKINSYFSDTIDNIVNTSIKDKMLRLNRSIRSNVHKIEFSLPS